MPTYEYECLTNRHRFEVKQSFTDDALTTCQVCDEPVRKVFSAAGIVFKGSGYYVNDSRAPEKSANGSGEGGSDKGSGSTDAGTTSQSGSSAKDSDSAKASTGSSKDSGSSGTSASSTSTSK